jgi:hypothetical protein
LCIGPEAGEVDTAVTRARQVLYDDWPGNRAFATPVLFLRAEDGRLWKGEAAGDKETEDKETGAVQQTTVQNIGTQISGTITGDVTFGNKITSGGPVVMAGEGANVNIGTPPPPPPGPGAGFAALVTQIGLWKSAVESAIDKLSVSASEKKDLKDTVGKIRMELIKNQNMEVGRVEKLINSLGMMGSEALVDLTVKRLAPPLAGVGITLSMNTDFKVTVEKTG